MADATSLSISTFRTNAAAKQHTKFLASDCMWEKELYVGRYCRPPKKAKADIKRLYLKLSSRQMHYISLFLLVGITA